MHSHSAAFPAGLFSILWPCGAAAKAILSIPDPWPGPPAQAPGLGPIRKVLCWEPVPGPRILESNSPDLADSFFRDAKKLFFRQKRGKVFRKKDVRRKKRKNRKMLFPGKNPENHTLRPKILALRAEYFCEKYTFSMGFRSKMRRCAPHSAVRKSKFSRFSAREHGFLGYFWGPNLDLRKKPVAKKKNACGGLDLRKGPRKGKRGAPRKKHACGGFLDFREKTAINVQMAANKSELLCLSTFHVGL